MWAETLTTRRFVEMVLDEARRPTKLRMVLELGIRLLAPFNANIRETKETIYEYEEPFVVDHSKFERAFGAGATLRRKAIRRTLDWYRRNAATQGATG